MVDFPVFEKVGIDRYFTGLVKDGVSFDFESDQITTRAGEQKYLRCRGFPVRDEKEDIM